MSSAFDRTRRWLAGFGDPDELARALARTRVEVVVAEPTRDAEIAAALAATLLLRLDEAAPVLHLDAPHARSGPIPRLGDRSLMEELDKAHAGFDSLSRLVAGRDPTADVRLTFGGERSDAISVNSSGWRVAIGSNLDGPPGNPLAASFAGVLAAVEATKAILAAVGASHGRLSPWTGVISLWDLDLAGCDGPPLTAINLDDVTFVGAGGIGSATAWVLALLELTGAPRVIDNDFLDGPNLNRHLTAGHYEAAAATSKVDAFAALLDAAGARTEPILGRWQDLRSEQRSGVGTVVISVDHDPTRRDVQLDLPQLILNAGNSDTGLYRVTRHDFLHGACLRCISRGDERSHGPEESAARRLGLQFADILPLLDDNSRLPETLLARASITEEERARIRGVPARQALGIVCGQFAPLPDVPALSTPALSAAPGVLLASELVKSGVLAPALAQERNMLAAGILAGPHERWISHRAKQPGCECGDEIYRSAFSKRWPDAE